MDVRTCFDPSHLVEEQCLVLGTDPRGLDCWKRNLLKHAWVEQNDVFMLNESVRSREIARIAYDLWERNGRPEGRDQEFWLRAEIEVDMALFD